MNTTTETVQHTPTPWHIGPFGGIYGERDGPCIISATHSDGGRRANADENEAFIIRACNSHEALVAALKPFAALINWADVSESDTDDEAFLTAALNAIESFCGAKTAVLTVGDLRRAKAALATATQ